MPGSPRFPETVLVRTPGPPTVDPRTGNQVPGAIETTVTPAYLSQQPVAVLSAAVEFRGTQTTVISNYTLIVPPDVNLRADSEVVDSRGNVYRVNGAVARRQGLRRRPVFLAASVQLISDLGVSEWQE